LKDSTGKITGVHITRQVVLVRNIFIKKIYRLMAYLSRLRVFSVLKILVVQLKEKL